MPPTKKKTRTKPKTYAGSGVDIAAGDDLVEFLKRSLPSLGGFSGVGRLPKGIKQPKLLMATDGVGTKLLVAQLARRHSTIGIDLVAMTVNDLIVSGGRPLYFLDYFATGKLQQGTAREVIKGIIKGCAEAGCALVGGETAEMPGMYAPGHYDLAGFGVGVVESGAEITGAAVRPGDVILGLGSNGLHSNGYSLARQALLPSGDAAARRALARPFPGGKASMAQVMLRPTRIYVKTVLDLLGRYPINAMAHVTGGGIEGNLVRVLPQGARAQIRAGSWPVPKIFKEIARRGPVEPGEMHKVFNMGVGYILIVPPEAAGKVMARCKRLRRPCYAIGLVSRAGRRSDPPDVLMLHGSN